MTKFHPIGRGPVNDGNADGVTAGLGYLEYSTVAYELPKPVVRRRKAKP